MKKLGDNRGRPKCKKDCCLHTDHLLYLYRELKWSASKLATHYGVSQPHICNVIRRNKIKVRPFWSYFRPYKPKLNLNKKSRVWDTTDEILFTLPLYVLEYRFGVSRRTIKKVRKWRRDKLEEINERRAKERIDKEADAQTN